jgi:hypothetical protein
MLLVRSFFPSADMFQKALSTDPRGFFLPSRVPDTPASYVEALLPTITSLPDLTEAKSFHGPLLKAVTQLYPHKSESLLRAEIDPVCNFLSGIIQARMSPAPRTVKNPQEIYNQIHLLYEEAHLMRLSHKATYLGLALLERFPNMSSLFPCKKPLTTDNFATSLQYAAVRRHARTHLHKVHHEDAEDLWSALKGLTELLKTLNPPSNLVSVPHSADFLLHTWQEAQHSFETRAKDLGHRHKNTSLWIKLIAPEKAEDTFPRIPSLRELQNSLAVNRAFWSNLPQTFALYEQLQTKLSPPSVAYFDLQSDRTAGRCVRDLSSLEPPLAYDATAPLLERLRKTTAPPLETSFKPATSHLRYSEELCALLERERDNPEVNFPRTIDALRGNSLEAQAQGVGEHQKLVVCQENGRLDIQFPLYRFDITFGEIEQQGKIKRGLFIWVYRSDGVCVGRRFVERRDATLLELALELSNHTVEAVVRMFTRGEPDLSQAAPCPADVHVFVDVMGGRSGTKYCEIQGAPFPEITYRIFNLHGWKKLVVESPSPATAASE